MNFSKAKKLLGDFCWEEKNYTYYLFLPGFFQIVIAKLFPSNLAR
jgi:hypothetical protein